MYVLIKQSENITEKFKAKIDFIRQKVGNLLVTPLVLRVSDCLLASDLFASLLTLFLKKNILLKNKLLYKSTFTVMQTKHV